MRRAQYTIAATGLALLALTACNAAAPQQSAGSASGTATSGPELILVTPEPIGANEFLAGAQKGIQQAADAASGTARVFQSEDPSQIGTQLDAAVAAKPKVVAVVGFEFADALAATAPAHPDQQFLFVDACTTTAIPNVTCAVFREHEAVYLAGYEAGKMSADGKIGAVVALDTPQIRRYSDPFGAGAVKANPSAQFTALYVGGSSPFNDPGRAKEQALSLFNQGVDVLISAAAGGNAGVFDAARSAQKLAFGVDTNQCGQAPGTILDNVLKETDVVVRDSVAEIIKGGGGGTKSYGLAEGAMSLTALQDDVASSGCVIAQHPDVIAELKTIEQQVVSGEIKVDDPAAG